MKPVRLQLRRAKGFDLQRISMATNGLQAIVVSRPSKWGNPFKIGTHVCPIGTPDVVQVTDAKIAVELFRGNACHAAAGHVYRANVRKDLRGKNLACWCAPDDPCHADVLLEIANR